MQGGLQRGARWCNEVQIRAIMARTTHSCHRQHARPARTHCAVSRRTPDGRCLARGTSPVLFCFYRVDIARSRIELRLPFDVAR
jgi:hypothetical protein